MQLESALHQESPASIQSALNQEFFEGASVGWFNGSPTESMPARERERERDRESMESTNPSKE